MKKIISVITLLVLLIGSAFATNWVKVFTNEDKDEAYNLYLDFDAREPFYIKCESIEYFLLLQDLYEEVEVLLIKDEEIDEDFRFLLDFAIENNCYCIFMEFENWYNIELHINIDNSVTAYVYGDTEE